MTTILPSARSPWDAISAAMGQGLQQNLPQAVQQGYQRGQGLGAIDQLQQQLQSSGGDINKILPALAKAYTLNPSLERSGLGQQYLQQARIGNAFGQPSGQPQGPVQPPGQGQIQQPSISTANQPATVGNIPLTETPDTNGIIPTLKTQQEIDSEAKNWAVQLNDPNEYGNALNRLQGQNKAAEAQISKLENLAEEQGVSRQDMPEFMQLGKNHNFIRDPNKWVMATNKDWGPYKNAKEQLSNAFIPGFFRGLISSPKDRETTLKRLESPIQEILKLNPSLEPKIRADLQSEYLSPTEVELAVHPLSDKTIANLEKLPKGTFPKKELDVSEGYVKTKDNPFVSYEEARQKAPREMEVMNKRLVDFFRNNITPDTTLLGLRDKIWNEKDYEWRQIADAMQEATTGEKAIKLSPNQRAELTQLQTQAPQQSLSDVFSDWGRWINYLRGNK